MHIYRILPSLASALLLGATSVSAAPQISDSGILTDESGMTLYVFDKDQAGSGKSACNGPCADNWPPLKPADGDQAAGDFSIITRDDGSLQWAYQGQPLYLWVKDTRPGEQKGDGVKGVWHTAKSQ